MTQLVTLHGLPPAFRRFNQLPREDVESLIEVAIAALDEADGDSDFEAPTNEDDFGDFSAYANGPGCDIADAGGGNVEDQGEATAAGRRTRLGTACRP